MQKIFAIAVLLACSAAAVAQMGPPVPSSLELATIPDLNATQQAELRKIFLQRRDAEEALFTKQQADFAALRAKNRAEHDRIDETTDASLRKLLGEDGYKKFAEWKLANHPGGPRGDGMRMMHGKGPGPQRGEGPRPEPGGAPMHDGEDEK